MTRKTMSGAILSLFLATGGVALAQQPPTATPAPQNPTVPVPPTRRPNTPPERIAPADHDRGTLSEKLSKDHGTIKPPAVDPGMTVTPPREGATPVIPPPGSPGGNQSVVPK
ncbi:MAG TPA: hypothetical protein VHB27_15930 [Rhodopila sp.]|uniref:hypothetical protein n=1 Tax=Rhodopila sp. TaxID=2480087 RepID=UPI002CD88DA2|nr:hypothetical protein [Rhodopila sp.]HVY16713.1 hypothetical protein [Rhodopila sp.]